MQDYGVTAQYYDPLTSSTRGDVDREISEALAGLNVNAGPVLDIGAGTGLSTVLIASVLPDAEIFAIEPDPAMRSALMARIWSDPGLRSRVSILPFDGLSAPLPQQISGAVLSASLVHFSPEERSRLWPLLAERLMPSGRIIVEVQCPVAIDLPENDLPEVKVGRVVYRTRTRAERLSSDRQRWTMTYCALLDEIEIACDVTRYDCWTLSAEEVLAEAALVSLKGRASQDLVVLFHDNQ